jgi:hypothetical protein
MPDASSSIFISYSRKDQDYVKNLISAFDERGLPVWLDDRIDYGSAWQQVIEKHLRACQVFVLVMTPRSYESHWVQCELSCALELKKPIFPLLLEGERWFSVAAIQVVDVKGGAIPPDRFFQAVSTSIVDLNLATDGLKVSESSDVVQKADCSSANTEPGKGISSRIFNSFIFKSMSKVVLDDLSSSISLLADTVLLPQDRQTQVIDDCYADLARYLKNGQWQEADNETYRLMIIAVGKEVGQWFDPEDLLNFPFEPLNAIDRLWVDHSGGKFGFSVQKNMYVSRDCGGVANGEYDWRAFNKFCRMNGWDESIRYDMGSPEGHLPWMHLRDLRDLRAFGEFYAPIVGLAPRLESCNL